MPRQVHPTITDRGPKHSWDRFVCTTFVSTGAAGYGSTAQAAYDAWTEVCHRGRFHRNIFGFSHVTIKEHTP